MLLALLLQAAAPHQRPPEPPPCIIPGAKTERTCFALKPQRVYRGVWINYFEGQMFVEGAHEIAQIDRRKTYPWFSTYDPLKPFVRPGVVLGRGYVFGHGYRVRFLGRKAQDMDRKPLMGYGHFGMFPGLVILDEMLELEDLGPMPMG